MNVSLRGGASITINGETYTGNSISINGNKVVIDGEKQEQILVGDIQVTIDGDVDKLETISGDVVVHGDVGRLQTTSGDVQCDGDITMNVQNGWKKVGEVSIIIPKCCKERSKTESDLDKNCRFFIRCFVFSNSNGIDWQEAFEKREFTINDS